MRALSTWVLLVLFAATALGQHTPVVCIDPGTLQRSGAALGKKLTEMQVNWTIANLLKALMRPASGS